MAVCLLPGTELSFAGDVACSRGSLFGWRDRVIHHRTAIFRQINKGAVAAHRCSDDPSAVAVTFCPSSGQRHAACACWLTSLCCIIPVL